MADEQISGDDAVKAPFLVAQRENRGSNVQDYETLVFKRRKKQHWIRRYRISLVFNLLMLTFYAVLSVVLWRSPAHPLPLAYRDSVCLIVCNIAPIQDHVQYRVQVIADNPSAIRKSPFVSGDFEEADAAWTHLLRFHNLRIFDEEMTQMNISSISFGHGGGSHGMMAVFHELHCLKLVREAVHQEHYYKNMSQGMKDYLAGHTAHCIDILRAGAMCRADTTIFPYHWSEKNRVPNPTWVQKHECVDWEIFTEWLESRRVDIKKPNMLVHPLYGPSYPNGKHIDEPNGPSWYPLDVE
ncbi:hypothetical protein F4779DRAFT_624985 [Xylariaceae sp. FL0662B]|nr:hypothetical protein F4779DRAFT_624985 [Xylariaceae sp. FL0662B]